MATGTENQLPVTLLLVEDDVRQSSPLRSLFEEASSNITVIVAATLKEALAHDRSEIHAVLCDLGLPDSSGLHTLTALLAHFAPVPVIVLTAAADADLAGQAITLGADDYLPKAIVPPAAIRRVVRLAIRRSAERRAAAVREEQNKAVAQLGQLALTDIPSATLLGTICELTAHVLHVPGAMFMERTADDILLARATHGCTAGLWPPLRIEGDGPIVEAILTNRPARVDDVRERPASVANAIFGELQAVSVAAVPVRTSLTAPEGVLVAWRAEGRPFSEDDTAFLSASANILAAAMQRNATQEALRASSASMERILDAVPDLILRFGDDLRVQYLNVTATRALPFVTAGMHIDEFHVPDIQRGQWRSRIERVLASGVAERFDMEGLHTPNRYDVSIVPLRHAGAHSVIIVLRNVTERMRVQARYETLFASNVVGVFFCGADGVVTQANRAFLDLVGYEDGDVLGRRMTMQTLMSSTAQAIHGARLREIRERGVLPPQPAELVHRNGSNVPVLLASAVVDKSPDEIVTFVVDETATRRAENEVRNQTLLLDHARDAIILRDMEGRICFWNEGAQRIYGWTREEAAGKRMSDLICPAGSGGGEKIQEQVLSCGAWQGELEQQRRDGTQVIVDSRCSLIPAPYGEPPLMLIIGTDITDKKLLQRQLLHAQRIESLGLLAGGIAHDLNNILMPVLLGAQYLRRVALPTEAAATLDRMTLSARRGAELIKQLLTFARGHRVDKEVTHAAQLIGEVEKMLRETLPPSIAIETHVPSNAWSIACDPTQALQVLLNLGVNARDAMTAGGILDIRAENVEIDDQYAKMNPGASPGAYVMLSVADTCTGIPPDMIQKVFEPFFSTKAATGGTGLGLSTARAIVRNHGGFMNVYSEPGATVFKVYLPALLEQTEDTDDVQEPIILGNGELILVIDDEMATRDVTAATLQSYGYRVVTAPDGNEGIARYAQTPDIAVVVTDMLMPVLDGPATIRELRKLNPNVRVIGMSGYTRQRMQGPEPDLLLQKPFRAADLLAAIHSILSPAAEKTEE